MDDADYEYYTAWRKLAAKELGEPIDGQASHIAEDIATGVRHKFGDSPLAKSKLSEMFSLLSQLRHALNPLAGENPYNELERERLRALVSGKSLWNNPNDVIWNYPSIDTALLNGDKDWNCWPIYREGLVEVAEEYIRMYAGISIAMERVLISALAYQETLAFGQSLKAQLGSGIWSSVLKQLPGVCFRVAVAVALGIIASELGGWPAGILVATVYYLLSSIRHEAMRMHNAKQDNQHAVLLAHMMTIVKEVRSGLVPPKLLRTRLEQSTAEGAVWPPALWSLVLFAEHRCAWDFFDHGQAGLH